MPWDYDQITKFYDNYADKYDIGTDLSTYPSPEILSNWMLEYINRVEKNDPFLLDVGCGTGQSFDVIGLDASPKMLQVAQKYPFKELRCFDIQQEMPYKNATFDGILCIGVLDFVNSIEAMISQFSRLLKPNGSIVITIPETKNETLNAMEFKEIEEMVDRQVLKILKHQKLLGYIDSETKVTTYYHGLLLIRQ